MPAIMTLADALALTDDARVVTRSAPPYSIVHTNRAWCDTTGYKFTEVVGQTCSFLQGKATIGPALKALHKALEAQRPCHQVLVNFRRDGTPFRNTIKCELVQGGMFFVGTLYGEVIDDGSVPAMKRTAAELERKPLEPVNYANPENYPNACKRQKRGGRNVQLVDVMNNMTDPIVLCAKEAPHQIIHANKPWLEMCGYDQEEVEGLTNKILTGPETDKEATKRLMECVRRREPSMQTLINYKKGGVRFVNKVKTMPVHDDNDDLAGFMSMLHEVDDFNDNGETGTDHLWSQLQQRLDSTRALDTSADGAAATHAAEARLEAARKLVGNHQAVLGDVTNPAPVSQPELPRVGAGVRSYVDQALRDVARKLLGRCAARCLDERLEKANPAYVAQQAVWAATAEFLTQRIQSEPLKSGRAPDMSPAAAAAMRAVLQEVQEEAKQA